MNYDVFENKKVKTIVTLLVVALIVVLAFKETSKSVDKSNEELDKIPVKVFEKEYQLLTDINIETDNVKITFNNDTKDKIKVLVKARKDGKQDINQELTTLNIKFNTTPCEGLCLQKEEIIISVPKDKKIAFNITNKNGDIEAETLNINNSTIASEKGNITIKELNNVHITSTSDNNIINNNSINSKTKLEITTKGKVIIN